MFIEIKAGEAVQIGLIDAPPLFVINYKPEGMLTIAADTPDAMGREGVIYEGRQSGGDALSDADAQLLDAIAHSRDEDVEGRVIVMPVPMVSVSHIERDREELNAIADMLRAATTKEALETAYARLGRHLADHP